MSLSLIACLSVRYQVVGITVQRGQRQFKSEGMRKSLPRHLGGIDCIWSSPPYLRTLMCAVGIELFSVYMIALSCWRKEQLLADSRECSSLSERASWLLTSFSGARNTWHNHMQQVRTLAQSSAQPWYEIHGLLGFVRQLTQQHSCPPMFMGSEQCSCQLIVQYWCI